MNFPNIQHIFIGFLKIEEALDEAKEALNDKEKALNQLVIFLKKYTYSLHAYIKSMEMPLYKGILRNFCLHKAYMIPTFCLHIFEVFWPKNAFFIKAIG